MASDTDNLIRLATDAGLYIPTMPGKDQERAIEGIRRFAGAVAAGDWNSGDPEINAMPDAFSEMSPETTEGIYSWLVAVSKFLFLICLWFASLAIGLFFFRLAYDHDHAMHGLAEDLVGISTKTPVIQLAPVKPYVPQHPLDESLGDRLQNVRILRP